jgi:hypothetical protein
MVLPPVTWKVSESKISDLECSSVSERNFRIRLFRLDRIDLVEAWQPTAQSTLKACNYSDRIRSLREVNEFTFDAFSVLRGTHRVSFSALGKKAFHTTIYAIIGGDGHNAKVSYGVFRQANRIGRACLSADLD